MGIVHKFNVDSVVIFNTDITVDLSKRKVAISEPLIPIITVGRLTPCLVQKVMYDNIELCFWYHLIPLSNAPLSLLIVKEAYIEETIGDLSSLNRSTVEKTWEMSGILLS